MTSTSFSRVRLDPHRDGRTGNNHVALRVVDIEGSYEHTWSKDATSNKPVASPLFRHIFHRQDDVVKVNFAVALNPPPPPADAAKYVRALPVK